MIDCILGRARQKPLIVPCIHFPFIPSRDGTTYPTLSLSHTHDNPARVFVRLSFSYMWPWTQFGPTTKSLPKSQGCLPWTLSPVHGLEHGCGADDPVSIHGDLSINLRAGRRNLGSWTTLRSRASPLALFYSLLHFYALWRSFPIFVEPLCFWMDLFQQFSLIIPGDERGLNWMNGDVVHWDEKHLLSLSALNHLHIWLNIIVIS